MNVEEVHRRSEGGAYLAWPCSRPSWRVCSWRNGQGSPSVRRLAALVGAALWRWPAVGAVLVISVTPLVTGIDRGRLVPMLRPNEALVVAVTAVLVLRAVVRMPLGGFRLPRLSRIELSLILMAVANSVSPLIFMVLRGRDITGDDVSYAMVLWKYIAVYALVRHAVRTERAVRWCLWASLLAAAVVGLIGILQALDLSASVASCSTYYAPFGYTDALAESRGGSTIGLPAATADLMMLNIAIAVGLWVKDRRSAVPAGGSRDRLCHGDLGGGRVLQLPRTSRPGREPGLGPGSVGPAEVGTTRIGRRVGGGVARRRATTQRVRHGHRPSRELDHEVVQPQDVLLAGSRQRVEPRAGGPAVGPRGRREPGDRVRLDRERLHVARVGRWAPAGPGVRVLRVGGVAGPARGRLAG